MQILGSIKNIPEFSNKTYSVVGTIFALTITVSGGFLIYEIVTSDALTLEPEWNMFKSSLGNLCMFIGLICAIIFWGKFMHWTQIPLVGHRDSFGNWVWKENMDITEQILCKFMMPFIGHFIIEPIIYGAIIYYPLQLVIALVGIIFPYVVALLILGAIVFGWMFTEKVNARYHSVMVVLYGLALTVIFSYVGYYLETSFKTTIVTTNEPDTQEEENIYTGEEDYSEGEEKEDVDDDEYVEEEYEKVIEQTDTIEETGTEESNRYNQSAIEEDLLRVLPEGTTCYEGVIDTDSVVMNITKNSNRQQLYAMFILKNENVRVRLLGTISSYGKEVLNFSNMVNDVNWLITLKGTADHLEGTLKKDDEDIDIKLDKAE